MEVDRLEVSEEKEGRVGGAENFEDGIGGGGCKGLCEIACPLNVVELFALLG